MKTPYSARLCLIVCSLVSILISSSAVSADSGYWRITLDRATIISNGGALQCEKLAAQLLAFESVFRDLAGWEGNDLPPIALYRLSRPDARRFFLSKADLQRQKETNTRIYSKFLPGLDFNLAVIIDDDGGEEPLQSVLLLYAQAVMQTGTTRGMPLWFQFGVPNVLNGLLIRKDGSIVLNRRQPFEPAVGDKQLDRVEYDLLKLLQAGSEVFAEGGDARRYVRRARDWAQFGLMATHERREQFRELATLMRQGEPAEEAVQAAFGIPLTELAAQFEKGDWRKEIQYRIPAPASSPSVPAATKLDASEAGPLMEVVASRAQRE